MKKENFTMLVIVLVVLLIIGSIYGFRYLNKENPEEELMKCIAEKSIMYSQKGCSHCIAQKNILGEYTPLFNIIECDNEPLKCSEANIVGTPTWIINGEKVSGTQTLKQLKELSGC